VLHEISNVFLFSQIVSNKHRQFEKYSEAEFDLCIVIHAFNMGEPNAVARNDFFRCACRGVVIQGALWLTGQIGKRISFPLMSRNTHAESRRLDSISPRLISCSFAVAIGGATERTISSANIPQYR
jgi:hypothetical protein